MMNDLRIHTHIHSRYRVFDASGQLPFSIVFGLCRRSPTDIDPRPLLLETAGSALDVPYALAHGLLTLHVQDPKDENQWAEVDLSRLNKIAAKEAECLSLPSPVNRTEHWRDAFTVHQCHINVNGELASLLETGKNYIIRLTSEDLGVRRWAYSDRKQFVDNNEKPSHGAEPARLVNSKSSAGHATFTVVKNLPQPPRIKTKMRLCTSPRSPDLSPTNTERNDSPFLEVSVLNTGPDTITVQTRGHQRFLIPWDPFQPEPDADDNRPRIIDTTPHESPTSSLQVIKSATGKVVRDNKQGGTGPLTDSNIDRRPKAEDLVTLKPEAPIIRNIDIGTLMNGLEDGEYKIRMQSKGCRWWQGEVGKEVGEDGRLPPHLCEIVVAPLMLESQDEVELCIRDGQNDYHALDPSQS